MSSLHPDYGPHKDKPQSIEQPSPQAEKSETQEPSDDIDFQPSNLKLGSQSSNDKAFEDILNNKKRKRDNLETLDPRNIEKV